MTASLRCRTCGDWVRGAGFDDAVLAMDLHRKTETHTELVLLRTISVNGSSASDGPISDEVAAAAAQMWVASHPWYTKAWWAIKGRATGWFRR